MSRVILVTGANQGIGLAVVKQLAQQGHTVYLCARNSIKGKEALTQLHSEGLTSVRFLSLDVTDQQSVDDAVKQFSGEQSHLDVLINNAGVLLEKYGSDPTATTVEVMKNCYEVNVFGVVRVTTGFLPLIKKSTNPVILNISSNLGAISRQQLADIPHFAAYSSSKSALNCYTATIAQSLPQARVNVMSPGWVATAINGFSGPLTPDASAQGVIKYGVLIDQSGPTGQFLSVEGGILPW